MARSKSKRKDPPSLPLPILHKEGESRGHYTRWTWPDGRPVSPDKTPDSNEKDSTHERED